MGGSSYAHVLNQIGDEAPDMVSSSVIINCFNVIQELIDNNCIYSGHDRSDGGLLTTLVEMAIAGNCGFDIDLPDQVNSTEYLWNEEAGVVIEVHQDSVSYVANCLSCRNIPYSVFGKVNSRKTITVQHNHNLILNVPLNKCRELWESTSFELEKLQCNPECVEQEMKALKELCEMDERYYDCKLHTTVVSYLQARNPYSGIRESRMNHMVAIVREEGSNGDREMATAFKLARFRAVDVTMRDLMNEDFSLDKFRGVVFVGGFTYADTLGAGTGWASVIENTCVKEKLNKFFQRKDTFSLGVCNGCQLMVKLGLFGSDVSITRNDSGRFESRFSYVEVNDKPTTFFNGMTSSKLGVWVAHGEGKFVFPESSVNKKFCIPLQYVDANGDKTMRYPYNPNGSTLSTAGISTMDGRHLAMMPHPERTILSWQAPWIPTHWKNYSYYPWIHIFSSAYNWCVQNKKK